MPLKAMIAQREAQGPMDPAAADDREGVKPDDTKEESFKLADFYVSQAKAKLAEYQSQYKKNQERRLGENVYALPKTRMAVERAKNVNQSLRNYTFAMVDHLEALLTGTPPRIVARAKTTQPVPDEELLKVAQGVKEQLEEMDWLSYVADACRDGFDGGVGYLMVLEEEDEVTGEYTMSLELLDPTKSGADPRTNRLEKAHYFYIEEEMPMAEIRQRFGDEIADQVESYPAGQPEEAKTGDDRRIRSEREIIQNATGQELIQGSDGQMREHVANVRYVWIRDKATVTEAKKVLKLAPEDETQELPCPMCSTLVAQPEAPAMEIPCPRCGYDLATDPEVAMDRLMARPQYPYGRLIITAGKKCVYDGANYEKIRQVFPIVSFMPYPENRRPIGASAVGLVRKSNATLNKNQNLAMAYVQSGAMGIIEYPKAATEYQKVGNNPQMYVGIDEDLCGIARRIDPATYNIEVHKIVDEDAKEDMKFVLGLSDVTTGSAPASPTSGREVFLRQRAGSTRMGRLQKRFATTCTNLAQLVWSIMRLRQTTPRLVSVPGMGVGPDEFQPFTPAMYPDIFEIEVTCDPEAAEHDENKGQNTMLLIREQILPPALDIVLPALGFSYSESQALQARKKQYDMQQAQAVAMGLAAAGPPQGAPGAPPQMGNAGPGRPAAAA